MSTRHRRFFWMLAGCFGATLLPIFILNMILLNDTLGNNKRILMASEWQQRTRGVTYAPTLSDTHLFKTLRLIDRLPEINTVVLGSSTVLGITQHAFPDELRIFNFGQTGNGLSSVIGEAEYIQQNAKNVKWMFIPLDWSIGFIYHSGVPPSIDLSAASAMRQVHSVSASIPLLDRMRDALSYPRISSLFDIFRSVLRSDSKFATLRGYFSQNGSDDYRCADGTPGKDFDTFHRGTCTGFRFDGSATFANSKPVDNARALILSATTSSSKYHHNLALTDGVPDAQMLQRLARLAERARQNGGGVVLFMPPLLPGMEAEFLRHPQLAPLLKTTKRMLADWADANHLVLLDAGAAELFGCGTEEFIDEHHAVASCYDKMFHSFWRTSPLHFNGK